MIVPKACEKTSTLLSPKLVVSLFQQRPKNLVELIRIQPLQLESGAHLEILRESHSIRDTFADFPDIHIHSSLLTRL